MKKYSKITLFFSIIFILLFIYLGYYYLKKEFHLDASETNIPPPVYQKTEEEKHDEKQIQYRLEYTVDNLMTQIIHLNKGEVLFKLDHYGDSDFIVTLKTPDGELIETIAKVKGKYNDKKMINIDETGPYLLDIFTDGRWRISYK